MADHAQVVLLATLHVVLAHLPHGSSNPLPVHISSLGRDRRGSGFGMCLGVGDLAVAVAVVGLLAPTAFEHVVAVFAAAEAFEGGNPIRLLVAAGFLRRLRRGGLTFHVNCSDHSHGVPLPYR